MLLMGKSTISMAIFSSYFSLPEGNYGLTNGYYRWLNYGLW